MKQTNNVVQRSLLLSTLLLISLGVLFYQAKSIRERDLTSSKNRLRLGENASSNVIDIPIEPPQSLNFWTKTSVLELRKRAVVAVSDLVVGDYEPSETVFGRIEDNRPWWGLKGNFLFKWGRHPGKRSIEGVSSVSVDIKNPFLLLIADCGFPYNGRPWDVQSLLETNALNDPSFPLEPCTPTKLRWYPQESRAEATYEFSKNEARIPVFGWQEFSVEVRTFAIMSINARDFGYNYVALDLSGSDNIGKPDMVSQGVHLLKHYIHRGPSCQYPGGCNNWSPATPEIGNFHVTSLPAVASFKLWKREPLDLSSPPDVIFNIRFL